MRSGAVARERRRVLGRQTESLIATMSFMRYRSRDRPACVVKFGPICRDRRRCVRPDCGTRAESPGPMFSVSTVLALSPLRAVKPPSRSQRNDAITLTPVLPEATTVRALSAPKQKFLSGRHAPTVRLADYMPDELANDRGHEAVRRIDRIDAARGRLESGEHARELARRPARRRRASRARGRGRGPGWRPRERFRSHRR